MINLILITFSFQPASSETQQGFSFHLFPSYEPQEPRQYNQHPFFL